MSVSPRVYRRRRFAVAAGVALALSGATYFPMTLLAPVEMTAPELVTYEAPQVEAPELAWPANASSAVGAVGFPGVLAAAGSTQQRPIASITKIVTALVVLDAHPLGEGEPGPTIDFGAADVRYYNEYLAVNGSVKPVYAGLRLSQRDVLNVVLIPSANNYAKSLATWAFGSESAFLDAARVWLDERELTDTVIYEPTGMNPANASSAANLLEIAKLAVADPVISEIVAKPSATIPGVGTFQNSNKLLGELGIDGIKTGTLDAAGACLLFSADYAVGETSVTIVGVALGGVDHKTQFPQVRGLLETVEAGFHQVELVAEGTVFARYATPWDDAATAIASASASELLWGDPAISARVVAEDIRFAEDGSPVGSVTFTVDDRTVTVPLELDGTVDDPGPAWRLGNPFALIP